MLSAQAAYAEPAPRAATGVDPLVALSVFGTDQSRAAVCKGGSCNLAAPISASAAAAATAAQGDRDGKSVNPLLLGVGFLVVLGILIAIAAGGSDGEGNLTPISPQ